MRDESVGARRIFVSSHADVVRGFVLHKARVFRDNFADFVNFTARDYVCSSKKNILYHTCVNYSHRSSSDILSLVLNFILFVKLV